MPELLSGKEDGMFLVRRGPSGQAELLSVVYASSRAVQFHPNAGQFDFVWLPAHTPHVGPQYVW